MWQRSSNAPSVSPFSDQKPIHRITIDFVKVDFIYIMTIILIREFLENSFIWNAFPWVSRFKYSISMRKHGLKYAPSLIKYIYLGEARNRVTCFFFFFSKHLKNLKINNYLNFFLQYTLTQCLTDWSFSSTEVRKNMRKKHCSNIVLETYEICVQFLLV